MNYSPMMIKKNNQYTIEAGINTCLYIIRQHSSRSTRLEHSSDTQRCHKEDWRVNTHQTMGMILHKEFRQCPTQRTKHERSSSIQGYHKMRQSSKLCQMRSILLHICVANIYISVRNMIDQVIHKYTTLRTIR